MTTIVRSTSPTCPACGFRVFNRRCTTCEKCHIELPPSVAYTAAELATMRSKEQKEEKQRAERLAAARAEGVQRTLGAEFLGVGGSSGSSVAGSLDALDPSDLLGGD